MENALSERLIKLGDVLHGFFGHYETANMMTLLARLVAAEGIENNEQLESFVVSRESESADSE